MLDGSANSSASHLFAQLLPLDTVLFAHGRCIHAAEPERCNGLAADLHDRQLSGDRHRHVPGRLRGF